MFEDLRYSLRSIRQAPGFSLVVTLTVMLGVGATTAIFSVVDAVLLRPLPYPAAESLAKLFDIQADGHTVGALSGPELADWRERSLDVFDAVGAFGTRGEVLSGAGEAEQLLGAQVTFELPSLLGIQPTIGRIFRPDDERPGMCTRVYRLSSRKRASHVARHTRQPARCAAQLLNDRGS